MTSVARESGAASAPPYTPAPRAKLGLPSSARKSALPRTAGSVSGRARSASSTSCSPSRLLQITREIAQRPEAAAQVVEHEEQDAGADGEGEQDVDVVTPGIPGAAGTQDGVVQVVKAPEEEGGCEERSAAGANALPVAQEHPPGPQGREAEEEDRRPHGPEEVIETVDGDVRPHRREEHQREIPVPPAEPAGEHQGGIEQREGGPPGDHLVPVEPDPVAGEEKADDGGDPDAVEAPRRRPPGEIRLAVAPVDEPAQRRQAESYDRLEEGRVQLGRGGGGDGILHGQ